MVASPVAQRATGSSTAIAKFCSTDGRSLGFALAGRGSERSAEFGSVDHIRCGHARANNRETRRLLTNRPCSSFFMDLGDTVLAKAIGHRLIHSLRMQEQRKRVCRDGKRHGVSVWQLPKRDEHPSLI